MSTKRSASDIFTTDQYNSSATINNVLISYVLVFHRFVSARVSFVGGVPEDVIAATMVAFGTSLPEMMTAITAVRKGHPEIAIGNVVGADVLNCLFVIGAVSTARDLVIPPDFFLFHFPAMIIILWSFRAFISVNKDSFSHYRT